MNGRVLTDRSYISGPSIPTGQTINYNSAVPTTIEKLVEGFLGLAIATYLRHTFDVAPSMITVKTVHNGSKYG